MRACSSSSHARLAGALCAGVVLVAAGCKEKPRRNARSDLPTVWARATTDDVVLRWRTRCGTEAKAQRRGTDLQVGFKSGDETTQLGCILHFREKNRDLLSASIVVTSADPKFTGYQQWAKVETEAHALFDSLLPTTARKSLSDALQKKSTGNVPLGDGLAAQLLQAQADGVSTTALNIYLADRGAPVAAP